MTQMAFAMVAALLFGIVLWWVWMLREEELLLVRRQTELASLGRGVRGIAHDLGNLLTAVLPNLQAAKKASSNELGNVLADVDTAARAAVTLVNAMQGKRTVEGESASAEGVVRLMVALAWRAGRRSRLVVSGVLLYSGERLDVMRVVQNLLDNAVREAAACGGCVHVELLEGELRVTNPLRFPERLDDAIYREGVSHNGSSGLGLAIAVQAAARLGWRVHHEVVGRQVTFVVASTWH